MHQPRQAAVYKKHEPYGKHAFETASAPVKSLSYCGHASSPTPRAPSVKIVRVGAISWMYYSKQQI